MPLLGPRLQIRIMGKAGRASTTGMQRRGIVKKTFGLMTAVALTTALVACGPEPMTVTEACDAYKNLNRNSPQGEVARAEYSIGYYKDWSRRIDGALGAAFAGMAESAETVIEKGEPAPLSSGASKAYWETFGRAYSAIIRICA